MTQHAQNKPETSPRESTTAEMQQASGGGVTLPDLIVSSYQTSGHGGDALGGATKFPIKVKHNV